MNRFKTLTKSTLLLAVLAIGTLLMVGCSSNPVGNITGEITNEPTLLQRSTPADGPEYAGRGGKGGGGKGTPDVVTYAEAIISSKNGGNLSVTGVDLSIPRRALPNDTLYKMISIILFSTAWVFIASFLLTLTEPNVDILRLVFEEISAFCTVGLTTGITKELSDGGKVILIASMFVGRIGTLTLAFALSSQMKVTSYSYPNTHIMIG